MATIKRDSQIFDGLKDANFSGTSFEIELDNEAVCSYLLIVSTLGSTGCVDFCSVYILSSGWSATTADLKKIVGDTDLISIKTTTNNKIVLTVVPYSKVNALRIY